MHKKMTALIWVQKLHGDTMFIGIKHDKPRTVFLNVIIAKDVTWKKVCV